jgi:hypothetical protein
MKLMLRLLSLALLVVLAKTAQASIILYETGFESPTFATGPITGQDGWSAGGTIQTSVVSSGNQALRVANEVSITPVASYAINVDTVLRFEFDFQRASGLAAQAGIAVIGDTGFIGQFATAFDPGTVSGLGNTNSNTPLQPFVNDVFHRIVYELNFASGMMEGFIDGVSSGSLAINNPVSPTEVTLVRFYSGTSSEIFVDNLRISAVPAPAPFALLGMGLLSLLYVGKRR